jgi:hypothetical protein
MDLLQQNRWILFGATESELSLPEQQSAAMFLIIGNTL